MLSENLNSQFAFNSLFLLLLLALAFTNPRATGKLSCRRETARQLLTWRGWGL